MIPNQSDRRTFFGGISAVFFGLFLHKKVAAAAPTPPPPPATPSVPTSPSLDKTAGNTSTISSSSSDNFTDRPAGRGEYYGITYTYTEEGYEQAR